MKKTNEHDVVTEVREEAIPGLTAALTGEREAEAALASVHQRLEAAQYAHATARAYRTALVQRSAAGDAVPPGEVVAAGEAIEEAKQAVETFPDVLALAERAAAKAAGAVTTSLRGEMHRRRQLAHANANAAEKRVIEAFKAREVAADQLRNATRAAEQPGETLRGIFAAEIDLVGYETS